MESFAGKKAVVIGGSGGIGKEISRLLAASGASLVVHGGHESPEFCSFIDELQTKCPATGVPSRISKVVVPITVSHFAEVCVNALAHVVQDADIVCVCFGPFVQKSLDQTTIDDWQLVSLCDYALPGFLVSTALPHMIKQHWGRFLLFGGTRTYMIQGFATNAAYAGAKTGVCSLVRSVAWQYAREGITCNALLPGFVDTEYLSPDTRAQLRQKSPTGMLLSPASIAQAGMQLLQNQHANGVLFNVDDGWVP
ncbi:MAG: SDR family oxidoreductase [Treponema sp.]|nr:SDR family oxidoreductase [Treponema sp.]